MMSDTTHKIICIVLMTVGVLIAVGSAVYTTIVAISR